MEYLFPCIGGHDKLRTQKDFNSLLIQDLITQYSLDSQSLWDLHNHELDKGNVSAAANKRNSIIQLAKTLPNTTQNQRLVSHILYGEMLLKDFISTKKIEKAKLAYILKSRENRDAFLNQLNFNIDYIIARLQEQFIGTIEYGDVLANENDAINDDMTLEQFEDSIVNGMQKPLPESCIINELAIIGDLKKCRRIMERGYVPDEIVPELKPLYIQDRKEKVFQMALALKCLNIPIYLVGDLANLLYATEFILGLAKTIRVVQTVYMFCAV